MTKVASDTRRSALVLAGLAAVAVVAIAIGSEPARGRGYWLQTLPLAMIALASLVAYLVIFVRLHFLPTGYNPVRHAVSDYALSPYGHLFRAGLAVSSFGVLALALALSRGVGAPPLARRDLVYLVLIAVARVGMTLFATTLEGRRLTRDGLLHYACAIAAFTFTYLAISEMTPVLRGLDPARWLDGPLGWTAAAVGPLLIAVVVTMLGPLRVVFGLAERLFLVITNVWFVLVAVQLVVWRS